MVKIGKVPVRTVQSGPSVEIMDDGTPSPPAPVTLNKRQQGKLADKNERVKIMRRQRAVEMTSVVTITSSPSAPSKPDLRKQIKPVVRKSPRSSSAPSKPDDRKQIKPVGKNVRKTRREPSVETTDDSFSATSTPKMRKRIKLVDNNVVPQYSPERTARRPIARDVDKENPQTPARRCTRVALNTSKVTETGKPQTRSNLSSARAKRAAARAFQIEVAVTPARTRRTRKVSTSSVSKQNKTTKPGRTRTRKDLASSNTQVKVANKPTSIITKSTTEGLETTSQKSTSLVESENAEKQHHSPSSGRKCSRLQAKDRNSKSEEEAKHNVANPVSTPSTISLLKQKAFLSECSVKLIRTLDMVPKGHKFKLNKSASELQNPDESKIRSQRTKSWPTLSASPSYDGNFFSDNKSVKTNLNKLEKLLGLNNSLSGSGDSVLNKSEAKNNELEFSKLSSNTSSKEKKIHGDVPLTNEHDIQDSRSLNETDYSNKSAMDLINQSSTNRDSNKGGDNQCVPVVFNTINPETEFKLNEPLKLNDQALETPDKFKTANNFNCEPMDIDKILPESSTSKSPQVSKIELKISINMPVLNENEEKKEIEKDQNKEHSKNESSASVRSKSESSYGKSGNSDKESEFSKDKSTLFVQDEEERRYETDHEILDKGETVTSIENLSTDYIILDDYMKSDTSKDKKSKRVRLDSSLLGEESDIEEPHNKNDASPISENEEMTKNNYSVLNLNKEIKSNDNLLNQDNKSQEISIDSVVEELNLALINESKKSTNLSSDTPQENVERVFKLLANDEDSKDSTDLKLVYSEESTSSEEDSNAKKIIKDNVESVVPLKRSYAQTDITDNTDNTEDGEEMFSIDVTSEVDYSIDTSNKKGKPIEERETEQLVRKGKTRKTKPSRTEQSVLFASRSGLDIVETEQASASRSGFTTPFHVTSL